MKVSQLSQYLLGKEHAHATIGFSSSQSFMGAGSVLIFGTLQQTAYLCYGVAGIKGSLVGSS